MEHYALNEIDKLTRMIMNANQERDGYIQAALDDGVPQSEIDALVEQEF